MNDSGPKSVACPKEGCDSVALVGDEQVTLPGVGYCGHEYLFRMVKVRCVSGHVFDALDEEGSVHTPDVECEGAIDG